MSAALRETGPAEERHPVTGELRRGVVTSRSLVLGAIGAAAVGLLAPYSIYVLKGSWMELDFSTPLALFLFLFLTAGPNLVLLKLWRRLALRPAELVTIYTMMIIGSALVTMGLTSQILPVTTGPLYYASPENRLAEEVVPHLKPWLLPQGARPDAPVIKYFYEGLPPGQSIPWRAWMPMLLAWAPLLLALYLAMIAMMVLLRKQWVENERLAYPLTFLPLELTGARSGGWPVLLKLPVFWIGFAVAASFAIWVGLAAYFPAFPRNPHMAPWTELIEGVWTLVFRISFPMIGFFFLVSLDTTFSLWFFNLIFQGLGAVIRLFGLTPKENVGPFGAGSDLFKYLGTGAFLALIVSGLWVARPHLRQVADRVLGRGDPDYDRDEILSYSQAFWLMVISLAVMGLWLVASGMPALVVPFFLLLAFVFFIGLTRVVVESGMAEAVAPSIAPGMTAALLGTPALGTPGMISLALTYTWCSDIRTFVMASAAHGLRMTTTVQRGFGRLFWGMVIAILVAFAASFFVTLHTAYTTGAATTIGGWFFGSTGVPTIGYRWAVSRLQENAGPSLLGWTTLGVGALLHLALAAARFRFSNWPFHPLGFALAPTWIMDAQWFTVFLTWLVKTAILRYGGMRAYVFTRPFFLGLIMGQFSINVLWLVLDKLTGHTGVQIFWI